MKTTSKKLNTLIVSFLFCLMLNAQQNNNCFAIADFGKIPSLDLANNLNLLQVELLEYLKDGKYLVKIPCDFEQKKWTTLKILSLQSVDPTLRTSVYLNREMATKKMQNFDVAILFHSELTDDEVDIFLAELKSSKILKRVSDHKMLWLNVNYSSLEKLLNDDRVKYVDILPLEPQQLNNKHGQAHGVNCLQNNITNVNSLTGEGICIGLGDGGETGEHIDLRNRVFNEATNNNFGLHTDHVAGTIAGSGNLNIRYKGMAPKSQLVSENTLQILLNAENYMTQYNMTLTNNSYGNPFDCTTVGAYNFMSYFIDEQMRENPNLLHVFAAGNSGNESCGEYPQGYHTILPFYQTSKNSLTVGNIDFDGQISPSSSRGPVLDGRIKPEICAIGEEVLSTGTTNEYTMMSGTSMSAPIITGTLALLYEDYKLKNNNELPDAALMKAVLCNTADDLGNVGPDFTYGFGKLNARRANHCLNENQYFIDEINNGETKIHAINIPENVAQVKIMLYWLDREGNLNGSQTLVNDLDLTVHTSSNQIFKPWVLNPSASHVTEEAIRGSDHVNNIEQVTMDQVNSGLYNIEIEGFQIPFGMQKYFVIYDFIYAEVLLNHPVGNESFTPDNVEIICWEAEPSNESTFRLEYSVDGGNLWTLVNDEIDANLRYYNWTVPSTITELGQIRIVKNDNGDKAFNEIYFSILDPINNFLVETDCEGQLLLSWDALDFAVEYEVFKLNSIGVMELIDNTTSSLYVVSKKIEIDEEYWFAVRPKTSLGNYGMRTVAQSIILEPNFSFEVQIIENVSCAGNSDGIAKIVISNSKDNYSYLWDNGENSMVAFNLTEGSHTVTVTQGGVCEKIIDFYIESPQAIYVEADIIPTNASNGRIELLVEGGMAPYTFEWENFPTQTEAILENLPLGEYTVTISDANHCEMVQTYILDSTVDQIDIDPIIVFDLGPNPTTGTLFVNIELDKMEELHLSIFNEQGGLIRKEELGFYKTKQFQMDVGNLSAGLYFLKISGQNFYKVEKLVTIN